MIYNPSYTLKQQQQKQHCLMPQLFQNMHIPVFVTVTREETIDQPTDATTVVFSPVGFSTSTSINVTIVASSSGISSSATFAEIASTANHNAIKKHLIVNDQYQRITEENFDLEHQKQYRQASVGNPSTS